ncbi:VTC domain-containing protein [Winogradskya consettensis]|uniref:VTC domain-containing protein n=1 Tax=Winogradskya consettensis TaxID=113560 RepID=A0A919S850_9ACTN|nr:polyphosphate polymerase domain-containing protein [Actinoplanes consettensis]GIM66786.1 VTC domain-containing protein [Actinoplanes consettensis]
MIAETLDRLPPIGLAELTDRAALMTRRDRKYVLRRADLHALLPELTRGARALDIEGLRLFRYASVYFDTPELTSYRLTALRRRRRFKVRTRTYVDSGACWLEVKTEAGRGGTAKSRLPHPPDDHHDVTPGRWFVDGLLGAEPGDLGPVLATDYHRATLFMPRSQSRLTIDVGLNWADLGGAAELSLPDLVVVETKTLAAAAEADRLLWAHGHRPIAISKYATGLAALRPHLPSGPWRRLLRRHFTPTE